MTRYNDTEKIREQYDGVSSYYQSLWGDHLHHGYWIRGDETKEQAQVQLIEHLAQAAGLALGRKLLDVGCGFGGSSIYLARKYNADATGITISPVQVAMASKAASTAQVQAKFLLMDAQSMHLDQSFDVIWSIESISHYQDKKRFFASAANLLNSGGTLAIIDWFKKENLPPATHKKFIHPIEKGMLVDLRTIGEYRAFMESNGLRVTQTEILNKHCAKTWDLGLDIIKKKSFWTLAAKMGSDFVRHLKAFRAMRAGFASANFVYALLVAKKP